MNFGTFQPGYIDTLTSKGRYELFMAIDRLSDYNAFSARCITVVSLFGSEMISYAEAPFKLIETIALAIITLFKAIHHSEGLNSLKYHKICLIGDLAKTSVLLVIIFIPILREAIIIYRIVRAVMEVTTPPKKIAERYSLQAYRIQMIRRFGYRLLRRFESLFPDDMGTVSPEAFKNIMIKALNRSKEDFEAFIKKKEMEYNLEEENTDVVIEPGAGDWICPKELEDVDNIAINTIKHILKLSHGVIIDKQSRIQMKTHLCNLLDIRLASTDAEMQKSSRKVTTIIHPDKNKNDRWSNLATQILHSCWSRYKILLSGVKS